MEGEKPIQPARRRRGNEGVEAQPGELGAGTGDTAGFWASGDAGNHPSETEEALTYDPLPLKATC